MKAATLAWDYSDGVLFVVHRPGVPPADGDWRVFMTDVRAHHGIRAVLILAEETRLGATQRAEIQKWYQDNKVRAALLTSSVMTRGIMTMLNWFGVEMRSFSPEDMETALTFINLPTQRWGNAQGILRVLQSTFTEAASAGTG